jgi:hypothetical protein
MKKIAFVVAAFMFAATAMGAVTITVTQNGDCGALITYVADANVSAFALDVNVSDGNITDINDYFIGECDDVNKGYGIFMGTIDILASGEVNDWGTPVGDPCDLPSDTKPGLNSSGITLEMGALYTPGNQPSKTGTLCTVTVDTACNMRATLNAGRGGIVYEDANGATLAGGGPTAIACVGGCTMPDVNGMTEAAAIAAYEAAGFTGSNTVDHVPDNANIGDVVWYSPAAAGGLDCTTNLVLDVGYAYPLAWDRGRQCHGDAVDTGTVDLDDFFALKDSYLKGYPNAAYDPNADFNRSGTVDLDDFFILKDNYLKTVPSDCTAGDPCGVYDPD